MKELLSYIDNPNIASGLKEEKLIEIANKVVEEYGEDRDSMSEWSKMVDKGMKVAKPAMESKSYPWEGASNYKSPMIYEAVISFGDRASTEILGSKKLVKGCIEGAETPEKQARMSRVAQFMNWQFNYEMPEWRAEQEQALYALAAVGCFFKKTFFDPTEGKNVSLPIFYPNFAVNQNERSMSALTRFTECKVYCEAEVNERIAAGIWLDQTYAMDDNDIANIDADDKDQSSEDEFLEQHCMLDLDDDGIAEPYIVTVHAQSQKVARIVARFDRSSILVKLADGVVASLDKAMNQAIQAASQEITIEMEGQDPAEAMAGALEQLQSKALGMLKIVKIKPVNMITKYGFIVAPDGTFLNWGYCHLLTGYLELINTTSNQTIDSGSLANMGGGFVSKEFRNNKSPFRVSPGKFVQTGVDAATMQQGIMPYPFKEPSASLITLNEQAKAEARNLTSIINMEGTIAPNAPAATTLGLLQEKMMPTTALISRILRSMSDEFRKMFDLNAKYTDPMTYQEVLDDPNASYEQDFTRAGYDIEPTAEAAKSSMMQKMQSTQVLMELMPVIQASGGQVKALVSEALDAIGVPEMLDKLYPEGQSDPQLIAMEQERMQMEQMNAQLQQQNNELLKQQHEIKMAMLQLEQQKVEQKSAELALKAQDQQDKLALEAVKLDAEAQRIEADENLKVAQTYKTYQEAEQIGAPQVDVTIGAVPDGMR
jgi:chaperonin GroES